MFSTAAVGDLYGTGSDDFVSGGASSQGFAYGKHYPNGGHVRIYNDSGGLICSANTTEEVDSSPAIGPILPGGHYGIATGTGSFFGGSDENTVKVFDTKCNQVWSDRLDGTTGGSPALADITGNGQLAVVEGTVTGNTTGSSARSTPPRVQPSGRPTSPAPSSGRSPRRTSGPATRTSSCRPTSASSILDGRTGQRWRTSTTARALAASPGDVTGSRTRALVTADQAG